MIVVLGPTATGKTALAARLAYRLGAEVISADSRQVYRGMDIGTGKDYADYVVNGQQVPVHLVDIVNAGYRYSVYDYQRDFKRVLVDLRQRGKLPVVCGGSGLYIESVLRAYKLIRVPVNHAFRQAMEGKSLDELASMLSSCRKLHNITDITSRKRLIRALEIEQWYEMHPSAGEEFPAVRPLVIGIMVDRDTRRNNISRRLKNRMDEGMVEEVRALAAQGVDMETLVYYGLEYKYLAYYLTGDLSFDEMYRSLETAIHRFAKRQMTWFRGMERRGIFIHWINGTLAQEQMLNEIIALYEDKTDENHREPIIM